MVAKSFTGSRDHSLAAMWFPCGDCRAASRSMAMASTTNCS
jgi:hypothetical protein